VINQPIGVFDSGIGGLSVVKEIQRLLPHEEILYFGDTERVPYGEKSPETIQRFSSQIAELLLSRGVKALVVACHTASAFALDQIQASFPVPAIGVISCGVAACAKVNSVAHIGVIGTRATIRSNLYQLLLRKQLPQVKVTAAPCPLFVPLAEEGYWEREASHLIARDYLTPLKEAGVDTLLLGCTHYPLLRPLIQQAMGPEVRLVDSATATAQSLLLLLDQGDLRKRSGEGAINCIVSDNPDRFRTVGSLFLGRPIEQIELCSASSRANEKEHIAAH
jgi:glutamate racemase